MDHRPLPHRAPRPPTYERRLARSTDNDALAGLAGNGVELTLNGHGLNLTRQHAIVSAVLDQAASPPAEPGARELDPNASTSTGALNGPRP